MSNSEDVERWRRSLAAAESELQSKSEEWEQARNFLCAAITKLARLNSSSSSQVSNEIDAIKKASSDPDDIKKLRIAVDNLTKKMMQEEIEQPASSKERNSSQTITLLIESLIRNQPDNNKLVQMQKRALVLNSDQELANLVEEISQHFRYSSNSINTNEADPSQFCALLISEILYQLLEKISLPADLGARISKVKKRLEKGVTMNVWPELLKEIALLASQVQLKINHERLDIEEFLKQVTMRLKELDSFIVGAKEHREQSIKDSHALGVAVKNEMENLANSADAEEEISELKVQIQHRLGAIEEHFDGFKKSENSRHENVNSDVKELVQRLVELEQESKTLKARVQKERMQAQIDTLTGIANRLGYEHRISQEYARWKRFKNALSLVVWDVDHFKRINDDYGHIAGDKALKTIAKILSDNVRETDYLARYGGEEFVLIMPGASLETAKPVADKLRTAVADSGFHFKGEPVSITISAGISEFTKECTPQSVFEKADAALYVAKESGRNAVKTSAEIKK